MINYIYADLKRILCKPFFYIMPGIFWMILILMIYIRVNPSYQQSNYLSDIDSIIMLYTILSGTGIFLSVFYDDFKAKTMQVALGIGITRNKIIFAKIIEILLIAMILMSITLLLMYIIPPLFGLHLLTISYKGIAMTLMIETLKMIIYLYICMPIVFYSQKAIGGIITYILLSTNIIYIFLNVIIQNKIITQLINDQSQYVLTNTLNQLKFLTMSHKNFPVSIFITISLYIIIPALLTVLLFKDKELEF